MNLPGKLIGDHYNGRMLGLPGRGKSAHKVNRDNLLRMPGNNRVDVDIVRQLITCPLTYITCPHEVLHLLPHSHPPKPFP